MEVKMGELARGGGRKAPPPSTLWQLAEELDLEGAETLRESMLHTEQREEEEEERNQLDFPGAGEVMGIGMAAEARGAPGSEAWEELVAFEARAMPQGAALTVYGISDGSVKGQSYAHKSTYGWLVYAISISNWQDSPV